MYVVSYAIKSVLMLASRTELHPEPVNFPIDPKTNRPKLYVGPRFSRRKMSLSPTLLPLPEKYRLLEELFFALESVLGYIRGKTIVFEELRQMIESTSSRTFLKNNLLQIASVAPHLYQLEFKRINLEDIHPKLCITADSFANMYIY